MTTGDSSHDQLHAELTDVQAEVEQARADLDRIRRGMGDAGAGTIDSAEGAADLTAVEEQQALLDALEGREQRLRERLGLPAA